MMELLNWEELLKSTMVLFAVVDIVGSIPILVDVKQKAGDIHAGRATLVARSGRSHAFLIISTWKATRDRDTATERHMHIYNPDIRSLGTAAMFYNENPPLQGGKYWSRPLRQSMISASSMGLYVSVWLERDLRVDKRRS